MLDILCSDSNLVLCTKNRGVDIYVTHLRPGLRRDFERGGVVKLLGEDAFYQDVARAASRVANVSRVASEVNMGIARTT
jgi:hypothetical protein